MAGSGSASENSYVDECQERTKGYLDRINAGFGATFGTTSLTLTPKNGKSKVDRYVGKVRDRYDDGERVYLVVTDRLSAFDRALAEIPFKGAVLNMVSKWWFEQVGHIIPNHIVSSVGDASVPMHSNVTVGKRCKPFPIEFVMRGYITGSSGTAMWTHYAKGCRDYCGIKLPEGMKKNQKLWENLITPTTKSDEHDELISPERIVAEGWMTQEHWDVCSAAAKAIFALGQKLAVERGLILVDTKYEFGIEESTGTIMLIDEIHTPDSSRYWLADSYEARIAEGKAPDNIDKEFVRLWYKDHCDPYKDEVLPDAPRELLAELSRRYIMLFEIITGEKFPFPAVGAVEEWAKAAGLDN